MKTFVATLFAVVVSVAAKYGDNNISEDAVLISGSIFVAVALLSFKD